MKAWSSFFADLLPQLPGCPDPLIEHELLRACQTFFEKTRAWQETQALVAVSANQTTFAIAPSDGTQELVRLEKAWLDSKPLGVVSAKFMDDEYGDDWRTHTGAVDRVVQVSPGTGIFYPIPLAASTVGLKLRLSVKPSDTATGIPDEQFAKHKDALACGALARLMAHAKKPWSDQNMAMVKAAVFEAAIGRANVDAARSFGSARVASRPHFC